MKNLLFLLLLLTNNFAGAKEKKPIPITDNVTVDHGEIITDGAGISIIGQSEELSYIGRIYRDKIYLSIVDGKGRISRYNKFTLPPIGILKRNPVKIRMTASSIFVFSTVEDKKLNNYMLFCDEIDINTLEPKGEAKKLEEISYEKRKNKGSFQIYISPEKNKVLLYKSNPDEKKGKETYDLTLFDSNMSLLWNENFELPYLDEDLRIGTIMVDEEGNVFMSAKKSNGLKGRDVAIEERFKNHYYSLIIFMIKKKGTDIKEFELDIENKWLTDVAFELDDDRIIGAGFYSEKTQYGLKGAFFFSIDIKSRTVEKYSLKEFSTEFMYANYSEFGKERAQKKEAKGKGTGLTSYHFKDFRLRNDGSALLLAEQNYIEEHCTRDPKTGVIERCYYTYHSNNIAAINIDKEGNVTSTTWIPKRQVGRSNYNFSYHLHMKDDMAYILFNDNIKNFQTPQEELLKKLYAFNGKKGIPVIVSLDKQGNQTRKALFLKDPANLVFNPNTIRSISNDLSLMYSFKGSKERYSRLIFN